MSRGWQEELVERVRATLPPHVWHFFATGAREGVALAESAEAWRAVRFRPRVLRGMAAPDPSTALLGTPTSSPVAVAPTSMQRLAHPGGEVEMARAANAAGTVAVVSSNAGMPFAEIGETGAAWWLQAYLTAERDLIAPTLRKAVAAGARAVVLTVDTPTPGTKYDIDHAAFGDLAGVYGANHPDVVRGETPGSEHAHDLGVADIEWLGDVTGLPVVVKGVLRPDDAQRAVESGARAVWVSNHGGRQLDRSVPTASALPSVAAAVTGQCEVYVDGGVTSGLDALAALALGARGVFLGRLPLYGLADSGAEGAQRVLDAVAEELREALLLAGCSVPADAPSVLAATPAHPT